MIRVDQQGDLWRVTLDRPDKANALTQAMLEELVEIAGAAQTARAVILTGTGKVFSAGADLEAARAGLATSPLWEELSGAISRLPGLTIAALNGTLAGGATGMALACDLRIAVPSAKFFYPVMKLGFLPQPSDPVRLARLVGPAKAKLMLVAGQKIPAEEALRIGLIDRIVDHDDLISAAEALTTDILSAPEDVAFDIKRMCQEG